MDDIIKILPLLIPVIILELILLLIALADIIKRDRTKGPKWAWLLVILFIQVIGPIVYLLFGRVETE